GNLDFYTNEGEHFFLCTKKFLPREAAEGIWIFIQMKVSISSYVQKIPSPAKRRREFGFLYK
ncbi:hypothetical protein QJU53_07270, partial [Pasteurella atlantica]|uniref:hypothetical protein n=1 Tax=Pasteurellaceae TaxID=712 RepID=UPI00275C224B